MGARDPAEPTSQTAVRNDTSAAPDDPESWIGLDYVYDRVLEQLDRQEQRWEQVDGRLRLVLGVVGIVFAAASGFVRSSQPSAADPTALLLPFWSGAAAMGATCLYLVAAALAAWAYRPQFFDRPPDPVEIRAESVTIDPREAKLALIDTILVAYVANEARLQARIRWFTAAYLLAAIGTVALGIALVGQLAAQTRALGT